MNIEQWSCRNDSCQSGNWFVQRPAPKRDLRMISADVDEQPFSLAFGAPVCPYCGTTLSAAEPREIATHPALRSAWQLTP